MLYFLVFIEGFISLAYQMLYIRQLTPEVGASAVTSSWIIGFFLLALALGYKRGGRVVPNPIHVLAKNLIKTGVVGGVAASSLFVGAFFKFMKTNFEFSPLVSLAIFCAIFVTPVAYWMGQSLPLLIQRSKWGGETSEISGNALYLSTVGSFVGAIATTNIFLFWVGATYTLMGISVLSLLLGAVIFKNKLSAVPLLLAVAICALQLGYVKENGLFSTPYADVYINQSNDGTKYFVANNASMSAIKDGRNTTWYVNQYYRFLRKKNIENADVLVLGAGGFMAHLSGDKTNSYTYVDIDPEFKKIAEEEFQEQPVEEKTVVADARRYLLENETARDVIFMDVFNGLSIPSHVVTKGFFELLHKRIKVGGYLVINSVIDPDFESTYSQRFHATALSSFPFCELRKYRKKTNGVANVIYICERRADNIKPYSDDSNQNEFDYFAQQQ